MTADRPVPIGREAEFGEADRLRRPLGEMFQASAFWKTMVVKSKALRGAVVAAVLRSAAFRTADPRSAFAALRDY